MYSLLKNIQYIWKYNKNTSDFMLSLSILYGIDEIKKISYQIQMSVLFL